jgi:hypothetical protein
LVAQGRLQVRGDGQTLGYVDGWTLSRGVYQAVACADIVYVKGARSHEALRGLRKPTYFGIVICREFSESVTGVCADSGSVTLFRQDSGDHSFSGFRRRHLRPIAWPSGRVGWLASETVLEYRRAKH